MVPSLKVITPSPGITTESLYELMMMVMVMVMVMVMIMMIEYSLLYHAAEHLECKMLN